MALACDGRAAASGGDSAGRRGARQVAYFGPLITEAGYEPAGWEQVQLAETRTRIAATPSPARAASGPTGAPAAARPERQSRTSRAISARTGDALFGVAGRGPDAVVGKLEQ
jgi:hypothetical protein